LITSGAQDRGNVAPMTATGALHEEPVSTTSSIEDATPRFYRFTVGVVLAAFIALVAYWMIWFFVDRELLASTNTRAYYVFENSFPAADGWLALACVACAWTLYARRPTALFWLLVGGSSAVYLALMDVLFDLENGIYLAPKGDWGAVGTEIAINVYSLGVGVWVLWFGWHHRRWFIARR
jgi:hypothetical protein